MPDITIYRYAGLGAGYPISECLTPNAKEKLKLASSFGDPQLQYANDYKPLYELNDSGWSFAAIADLLRRKPWIYFTNFDKHFVPQ